MYVSEEWQTGIIDAVAANPFAYDVRDYRRFLLAHFQLLRGLCELCEQSVHDSIGQFLASSTVSVQLRTPSDLATYIHSLADQTQSYAPETLTSLISLHRSINQGDAVVTGYGTNYQYSVSRVYPSGYSGEFFILAVIVVTCEEC